MDLHLTKDGFEKPKDKITSESFGKDGELSVRVTCDEGAEQSREGLINEARSFIKDNSGFDTVDANLGQCSGDVAKTDENGNTVYSEINAQLKLKNGK